MVKINFFSEFFQIVFLNLLVKIASDFLRDFVNFDSSLDVVNHAVVIQVITLIETLW